jgi:hypothetical protein
LVGFGVLGGQEWLGRGEECKGLVGSMLGSLLAARCGMP